MGKDKISCENVVEKYLELLIIALKFLIETVMISICNIFIITTLGLRIIKMAFDF